MNFRHPLKRNERYEINECLSLYLIDVKLCLNENYAPSSNRLQKKGGDLTFLVRCVGSVGNFVSRTIITGGQSSKVAHFLYGFSAGFGVCGGGGGGAHA